MKSRVYFDYNASAPLCEAAKKAIRGVLNLVGNPSSTHLEGRAIRGLVEKARENISNILDVDTDNLIFTSGATEGAALVLKDKNIKCSVLEHDCVKSWCKTTLKNDVYGQIFAISPKTSAVQLANSETGIIQDAQYDIYMADAVQVVGKIPFSFRKTGCRAAIISAHKFGGPKGIGALMFSSKCDLSAQIRGGKQEMGIRAGTENIFGIVGFEAALNQAKKDINNGLWDEVSEMRDYFENEVVDISKSTICIGKGKKRLPNTSYLLTPGWLGNTQVMQMDLNGFAVSAGSACSSGRVTSSETMIGMGYSSSEASSGLRVSFGVTTKKSEINAFLKAWGVASKRRNNIAA